MAKTAKKNKVLELKAQLKEKKLCSLYVFYGDEELIIRSMTTSGSQCR